MNFSKKIQSYHLCYLCFSLRSLFFQFNHFFQKKHAIGFKTRLKIGQSCKKKIENQNFFFEKNILL